MSLTQDIAIVGATIGDVAEPYRAVVRVHAGQIVEVSPTEGSRADVMGSGLSIDADGLVLLPGIIDPHFHFGYGDLDHPEVEWLSESQHANLGGVTTVNALVRGFGSYESLLQDLSRSARQAALVDVVFTPTFMDEVHIEEISRLRERFELGGAKFFLGDRPDDPGTVTKRGVPWDYVRRALPAIRDAGLTPWFHAENQSLKTALRQALGREGLTGLRTWAESSPGVGEIMDVMSAWALCIEAEIPKAYFVHISSRATVEFLGSIGRSVLGTRVVLETCPHYLAFNADTAGPLAKVNPPIRADADQGALWQAIAAGTISTIGSDHGGKTTDLKMPEAEFHEIAAGFPNSMHILPVLVTFGIHENRLTWHTLASLTAAEPARLLGLADRGRIEAGLRADLILVDPNEERTVSHSWHRSQAGYSVFEGIRLRGWPRYVIRGGEVTVGK